MIARPSLARAALVYFATVFAAGFVLGALRVTLAVPRIGERYAELAEMPLMFMVVWVCARYVVMRFALPAVRSVRLAVGGLALLLMLAAELLLAVVLAGRGLAEYFAARDPVSGGAYAIMLAVFALMPSLVGRGAGARRLRA